MVVLIGLVTVMLYSGHLFACDELKLFRRKIQDRYTIAAKQKADVLRYRSLMLVNPRLHFGLGEILLLIIAQGIA